jgi:hypothetical protein
MNKIPRTPPRSSRTDSPVTCGKIREAKQRRRGRPARPWLLPAVPVPHPHDAATVRHIPQAAIAAWTGMSRQTVARWARTGHIGNLPAERLCMLLAHGLPPIPAKPGLWAQFRFQEVWTGHGLRWVLVTPGGTTLNASQAWCAAIAVGQLLDALADAKRWKQCALDAEKEARRLRELVANQY